MFEIGDSSNRQQKWTAAPFSKFYGKSLVGFCLSTGKRFLLEVFFKANRKSRGFSKNCTRDIQNSPPFEFTKIKNAFPYKTAISEANIKTNRMGNTKWIYYKELRFASNYFIVSKILFHLSLRTSCKELIWCTNCPNVNSHTLRKRILYEGAFFLWLYLSNS